MFNFRVIATGLVGILLCAGTSGAGSASAEESARSDNNAKAIKVGVAVVANSASRSVPGALDRDRLVSAINHIKPPKRSKDSTKIQAVPLDSSSPNAARSQARDLDCDYVVFTRLTDLRESGDPAPPLRQGEVRIGRDPVANDPPGYVRGDVQRYAVIEFQLYRLDDPTPRFDTSASATKFTSEDGIVSMLIDRVASRVVSEIRSPSTRPPMQ